MKVGVVVFPGSNGDHDALYALGEVLGQQAELVWHTATDVRRYDLVLLPGGVLWRLPARRGDSTFHPCD
jgi:phosphoribosylformylglycinamidine (FGAM) synthase-like amidotransferase family enzyme